MFVNKKIPIGKFGKGQANGQRKTKFKKSGIKGVCCTVYCTVHCTLFCVNAHPSKTV